MTSWVSRHGKLHTEYIYSCFWKFASLKNLSIFRSTLLQNPEEYDIIILGCRLSGCIGSAPTLLCRSVHAPTWQTAFFYVLLLYREKGNLSSEMKKILLIQSQIWSIFLKTAIAYNEKLLNSFWRSNDKEKSQSQKVGSGIFIVRDKKRTCRSDCDFCSQNRISVGLSRRGSEFSGADGTDGKYEHGKICRYVWISYRAKEMLSELLRSYGRHCFAGYK